MLQAYLKGGPANGRVINHPQLYLYRHPVPKPISAMTIQDALQESFDPSLALPNYEIADYQFTGMARVRLDGTMQYMIYDFTGME